MQLFGTKEQEFHHCPRTKGQAKNLAKGQDGPEQLNAGTRQAGTAKIREGTWDKMGQSRKGHSKTGK